MKEIEKLSNKGMVFIGDTSALESKDKTFIVVGVARGGTSAVAGSLGSLGVFMGANAPKPIYEDFDLSRKLESGNYQEAFQLIKQYDESHAVWGFKRPSIINYFDRLHPMLRNPIYLFVFRDIFSIANRNSISMKSGVVDGLLKAQKDYDTILNFIVNNNINAYLLSYEKIMQDKGYFVNNLVKLLGVNNVKEYQVSAALDFIEPNPKDYLDSSRITKSIGTIGGVQSNLVFGWAKYSSDERVGVVELYINNEYVSSAKANEFRGNVLDAGLHSTGHCGFSFRLDQSLNNGDVVSVKLSDDIDFLSNSNKVFSTD